MFQGAPQRARAVMMQSLNACQMPLLPIEIHMISENACAAPVPNFDREAPVR